MRTPIKIIVKNSLKTKIERANEEVGYGPNNPEPVQMKEPLATSYPHDALEAVSEYIEGGSQKS